MALNTATTKPSGDPAYSTDCRTYGGVAGSARTMPPPTRPANAIDFGPITPSRIGGGSTGGASSFTSSRYTALPWKLTFSPARSLVTVVVTSSSVVSGDFGRTPICPIHSCTPWPMPGRKRPGPSASSVANSIAVTAAVRATAGTMPRPTVRRSVDVSAAETRDGPAV